MLNLILAYSSFLNFLEFSNNSHAVLIPHTVEAAHLSELSGGSSERGSKI